MSQLSVGAASVGLGLADVDVDALGLMLALGEIEADGDSDVDALGLILALGLMLELGLILADTLALGLIDGDPKADGEREGERETLALGDMDAEALALGLTLALTLRLGEINWPGFVTNRMSRPSNLVLTMWSGNDPSEESAVHANCNSRTWPVPNWVSTILPAIYVTTSPKKEDRVCFRNAQQNDPLYPPGPAEIQADRQPRVRASVTGDMQHQHVAEGHGLMHTRARMREFHDDSGRPVAETCQAAGLQHVISVLLQRHVKPVWARRAWCRREGQQTPFDRR